MTEEFEEPADEAIKVLRSFIDTEKQIVTAEHELHEKLMSWENVWNHLAEICPEGSDLDNLNNEILDRIEEIRKILEKDERYAIRIEKEEEHLKKKLEKDVKHKNWRAVKRDIKAEKKEEKKAVRLLEHELEELYAKFAHLFMLMKNKLKPTDEDLAKIEKEKFKGHEEYYYFLQIFKFVSFYERIFWHLLEKERILLKRAKKL